MPAPDFVAIAKVRADIRKRESALAGSLDAARRAQFELAEARRHNRPGTATGALENAAAAAEQEHAERLEALRAAEVRLEGILEPIGTAPDEQLAGQARSVPVALLPLRIETRLKDGNLLIRIYPDQIHLHRHAEQITAAESEAAKAYWRDVSAGHGEPDAWRVLTAAVGVNRARYLAARLRPGQDGGGPAIDMVETAPQPRPEARLLPTAWCATLIDSNGNKIARKWSKPVAQRLAMSPAGDLLDSLRAGGDGELPLDPEARWLVDFDEAEQRGMAIVLRPGDFGPQGLPRSIARLVVVGADWTMTPDDAAAALSAQLLSHSYGQGLSLPPNGAPTNRSTVPEPAAEPVKAAAAVAPPKQDDDLTRLIGALGLPSDAAELAGTWGSDRAYETTVRSLHTALWGSSFGFYLTQVLEPILPEGTAGDTRVHVRDFVRPAGPLPTLQVGRQPYGVLPILATPVRVGKIDALTGYEGQLARVLANARSLAEGYSPEVIAAGAFPQQLEDILAGIPNLHTSTAKPAELLVDILKLGPLSRSARVRPTLGAAEREAAKDSTKALAERHATLIELLVFRLAGGMLNSAWENALIYQLAVPGRPRYRLDGIPWVSPDLQSSAPIAQAVAKMRERIVNATGDPAAIRHLLATAADQAETLLEGLLLLSGAFEYWEAGSRVIREHIVVKPGLGMPASAASASARLASASLLGVDRIPAAAEEVAVENVAQMLALSGTATEGRTLIADLNEKMAQPAIHPEVRDIHAFDQALGVIGDRPAIEVDQALRGLLDAGSHRIDAWITSLATRRLTECRTQHPTGIHVGCYGIVHDLELDPGRQSSEGYVHLPSADHAVTAAILRSGHLANRDADPGAFAIQLTSGRVREALAIIEGMQAGQPASALLGYRFERWLIDDRRTAKYIGPLRQLKPLPFDAEPPAGLSESLAAHDVVDGLALAEAAKTVPDRNQLLADLKSLTGQPIDPPLDRFLDALVDLHDAFLDVWVAEAAHQMTLGNEARLAAAIATLDRQERPPEPRVTETPRKAWSYTQRVIWVVPADRRAEGWPEDLISATEPVANSMAVELLGDPDDFRVSATVIDATGAPMTGEARRTLKLTDLALSPLALVRAAAPAGGQGPSSLEARMIRHLLRAEPLPPGTGLQLEPDGASRKIGLGELMALLRAARAALFGRPTLAGHHLAPPTGPIADTAAGNALKLRAAALETWLDDRIEDLKTAVTSRDAAALNVAIEATAAIAPVPDWLLAGAVATLEELVEAGAALQATLESWRSAWPAPSVDPAAPDREKDSARIRLLLGQDFPILTPFKVPAALDEEVRASLADQASLTGPQGARELRRWRRAMSLVRPQLRAFGLAWDSAKGLKPKAKQLRVAQLPHSQGVKWASLPFAEDEPPRDVQLSLVVAGELPQGSAEVAGLLLDDWPEAVPERAAPTNITFHYDAPAARPPQAILLAVDAGLGDSGWSADALVDTVNEAFDLARLRLLPPNRIPGHGALLPTTFLPRNLSEEMPSFDLLGLAAGLQQVTAILGKAS